MKEPRVPSQAIIPSGPGYRSGCHALQLFVPHFSSKTTQALSTSVAPPAASRGSVFIRT